MIKYIDGAPQAAAWAGCLIVAAPRRMRVRQILLALTLILLRAMVLTGLLLSHDACATPFEVHGLEIGNGPAQLGVLDVPNTACQGPESIRFLSDNQLLILDSVNKRIVEYSLDTGSSSIFLNMPQTFLPSDMLVNGANTFILDAQARSVAQFVDGKFVSGQHFVPAAAIGGPATLFLNARNELSLQTNAEVHSLGMEIQPGTSLARGEALEVEPFYTLDTKPWSNAGTLRRRENAPPALPATLPIETKHILANAKALSKDEKGRVYVQVAELNGKTDFSGTVRVLRYDPSGKPIDAAIVPIGKFSCAPSHPIAISPTGTAVFLSVYTNQPVQLIPLKFVSLATSTGPAEQPALLAPADKEHEKHNEAVLLYLSKRNNRRPGSTAQTSIDRATIMDRAQLALSHEWELGISNYTHEHVESKCEAAKGSKWKRAAYLEGRQGALIIAIPYRWSGAMRDLAVFDRGLRDGLLASDVCTCRESKYNYCVVEDAIGMDCSGFVSYTWDTSYATTRDIPSISKHVDIDELQQGDALNSAGHHVRLFKGMTWSDHGLVISTVESSVACGRVCESVYTPNELTDYKPMKYNNVKD